MYKKYLPGIAWFFLVLILICLPGNDLPRASNWMNIIFFDKWVHTGLFGTLALLFMKPVATSGKPKKIKWNGVIKIATAISVWGLTTEFVQRFFIPGRNFDLLDWAADSFGVLLAVLICRWFYFK